MSPHGPGMTGALHSHDPEFPDDDWNLYSMIDIEGTTAYNVTRTEHCIGIFKPFVRRLFDEPRIISDADEEIIIVVRFSSPVHIRKMMVIGGGDPSSHPSSMRCFVNEEHIDFTNVMSLTPVQEFGLSVNEEGLVELNTIAQRFSNISTLTFYFSSNYGNDRTIIKYIGMQGEHSHYRREAVDTVYEVLCNGQDIEHKTDPLLGEHHLH